MILSRILNAKTNYFPTSLKQNYKVVFIKPDQVDTIQCKNLVQFDLKEF